MHYRKQGHAYCVRVQFVGLTEQLAQGCWRFRTRWEIPTFLWIGRTWCVSLNPVAGGPHVSKSRTFLAAITIQKTHMPAYECDFAAGQSAWILFLFATCVHPVTGESYASGEKWGFLHSWAKGAGPGRGGGKVHDHFLTKSVSLLHLPFLPSTSACLPPPPSGTWSSFNLLHLLTSQTPAQMVFPKINHGFLSADQQLIKRRLIKVAAVFRLSSPLLSSSARRVTIFPSSHSSHAKPS